MRHVGGLGAEAGQEVPVGPGKMLGSDPRSSRDSLPRRKCEGTQTSLRGQLLA